MSYIGRGISNLSDRAILDSISTSATATYNLLLNSVAYVPSSAESLTVSLNGIIQAPTSSYTVSGSTIIFASSLASTDSIDFILAERAITLTTIGSGTVTTSNIVDANVTTAKIADNAVTSAKLASGLIITAVAGQFRFTSSFANANNGATEDITANLEENDTNYSRVGSAITQSSGIFTFPSTGIYLVTALVWFNPTSASSGVSLFIKATANNSSYVDLAKITTGSSGNGRPEVITANAIFDVTNVSTHKIKFATNGGDYITYQGSSTINNNSFTFLKLGDT